MTVDGNKTDAIRRIWRYNSQRHPNVIVNGHVHSLIVAVPLMAPLICMSIREHYPLLLVALCFLVIGEWLLTEWHLYWIGQDRGQDMGETPRRDRVRMLFWVALNWGSSCLPCLWLSCSGGDKPVYRLAHLEDPMGKLQAALGGLTGGFE